MLIAGDGYRAGGQQPVRIDGLALSAVWPVAVFFALALVLVFSMGIGKDLDVDEHGFIASGVLLARHGVLPYRDYHYNHMPTEVLIYAELFHVIGQLVMGARTFQVICAAGAATTIFAVAYEAGIVFGRRRLLFAWAIGLLFLTNQFFTKTAALSWNHDFPLLMALLSFIALRRGLRGTNTAAFVALSGLLAGISATSRLTYLPIVGPMGLLVLLYPQITLRRRLALAAVFCGGFAVAALPSLWVWSKAWDNAFFGNFLYPRLNTAIHAIREPNRPFTFWPILRFYLWTWITFPTTGVATVAFAVLLAARLRGAPWNDRETWELLALAGVVLLLLAAAFMPAPPYIQYFYAATPFMFLGIAWCLPDLPRFRESAEIWRVPIGLCVFSVIFGASAYRHVVMLPFPRTWVPLQVHRQGVELARQLPPGLVLTIEPIFPLEGGMETDPRFAVGRFAPRVADLMTPADRSKYLMPGLADFKAVFDDDSPASVLVVRGADGPIEHQFEAVARTRGYQFMELSVPAGGQRHAFASAWVRQIPRGGAQSANGFRTPEPETDKNR
jgi:hypothetical protein